MIIANLLISSILIYSSSIESSRIDTLGQLLTKERLKSSYIQLIPFKGIVLDSDSILIGKFGISDLLSKIDTNSINCKLTVDKPKQLVCEHIGSPPPGYTGEYKPQPDEYFTNYSATLKVDCLVFQYGFTQSGKNVLNYDIYKDSLKITSIKVDNSIKAGLYDDLKIGDLYEQIFKHFEKTTYYNQPGLIRKEYMENGIIFTIETDQSQVDNYGRIIKIEINRLTRY